MNPYNTLRGLATTAAFTVGLAHGPLAQAQVPGEDPVVLTKHLTVQMQSTGTAAPSGQLEGNGSMPSWLRARIARYEAKAFSNDASSGVLSDNDVVTTASAQGMQKTCVQEVGSNTVSSTSSSASKYGPSQTAQIVVLRGDLVNICR